MPIFSSQLGKIESQNTEQSIKVMANHLRKIQEELEYRLMHLDSSNVTEIDARETTILIEDGEGNYSELIRTTQELRSKIGDAEDNLSTLQQTAGRIEASVQDANGNIGQLQVTANGISQQVADASGNLATLQVKADGIVQAVSDADGNIATLQATANGISQQVSDASGNLATLKNTADGIAQQVKDANDNYATLQTKANAITAQVADAEGNSGTLQQTATALTARVVNLETGQGTMLKLDSEKMTVTDAQGNAVSISGSCIDFGSATDADTIEGKIAAAANKATNAAGAASSALGKANDAYDLAESAYDLAESNSGGGSVPSYIKSTYIDATHMRSPDIYGGMFYATGRGYYGEPAFYLYDGWTDPGPDLHGSFGLVGHNNVGYLSYDDKGAGTDQEAKERVLLTSLNGTALKLKAAGDMSLEAGSANNIFVMSQPVFATRMILSSGVGYGASLPSSGVQGELFFKKS